MAISVVQRNIVGNAAAATNPTLAYGVPVTAGNALIAVTFVGSGARTVFGKPTDSLGNAYINLPPSFSDSLACGIFVNIAYNTPGGACTTTFTTGFNDSAVAIFEVSGLAPFGAFDTYAFQTQSAATALTTPNTPTTRYPNELLLGLTVNTNPTALNPTVGTSYTNLQTIGVTFASSATEEQIVSATGAQSATFTLAANSANELTAVYAFADTSITHTRFNNAGLRPHPFSPGLAR